MVTYQEEKYSDCIEELKRLYPEHYEELSVTKTIPLEPAYDVYLQLENNGVLKAVTCRKDNELIGYILFIVTPHLHYKSCLTAVEDIYFLKKEHRKGRIGIKLFQFAEEYLKSLHVNRVIFGTKVHLDNSKLFEYLGYSFFEKLYSKLL
jgi:GNAT superfamily N-acetyltransferase